jgi:hypothetical protein
MLFHMCRCSIRSCNDDCLTVLPLFSLQAKKPLENPFENNNLGKLYEGLKQARAGRQWLHSSVNEETGQARFSKFECAALASEKEIELERKQREKKRRCWLIDWLMVLFIDSQIIRDTWPDQKIIISYFVTHELGKTLKLHPASLTCCSSCPTAFWFF